MLFWVVSYSLESSGVIDGSRDGLPGRVGCLVGIVRAVDFSNLSRAEGMESGAGFGMEYRFYLVDRLSLCKAGFA